MEGLIPFLYRAVVQYKSGEQQPGWFYDSPSAAYTRLPGDSGWFYDSPSAAYTRLPGDSGRFGSSEHIGQIFRSEYNFSVLAYSPSSRGYNRNPGNNNNNNSAAATTQVLVASSILSPVCRVTTRRAVA